MGNEHLSRCPICNAEEGKHTSATCPPEPMQEPAESDDYVSSLERKVKALESGEAVTELLGALDDVLLIAKASFEHHTTHTCNCVCDRAHAVLANYQPTPEPERKP